MSVDEVGFALLGTRCGTRFRPHTPSCDDYVGLLLASDPLSALFGPIPVVTDARSCEGCGEAILNPHALTQFCSAACRHRTRRWRLKMDQMGTAG